MKKICFTIDSLDCGGAERSLISLLNNIDPLKYSITLNVIKKNGVFEKLLPDYVKINHLNLNVNLISRLQFFVYRAVFKKYHPAQLFWKCVKRFISEDKSSTYDVAISWGQGFSTYYTAHKINSKKKIAWVNIDFPAAGYDLETDRVIYEKFDTIVGVSDFVERSMKKYLNSENVIHIRNIIDIDDVVSKSALIQENKYSNNFNILSVGRLVKQKNFELAIESAKILRDKNYNFCWYIIGEGEKRDELLLLIKKYKLEEHVKFLGFIENPYPYIKNCDVYCQTSLFEGLGRVLIEASHLNKVIVSTDFPSAYSIIDDGLNGIICKMNPDKVALELAHLIEDKKLFSYYSDRIKEKNLDFRTETVNAFDVLVSENFYES